MTKGRILSGMRPTGKLHIGHLSVLENWVNMQNEYKCFYSIVDWHALTTSFDDTGDIRENCLQMAIDWLSVGIDPEKSVIFIQSAVKEHAELMLLFSMVTPISWLERCPTYKDQVMQLGKEGKDINTYGFLGYPLLQAADILIYRADTVPVGEDQLPHLELTREVARRFNFMYKTDIFPEPQAKLAKVALLPGIDGRKMSKSYNNAIDLGSAGNDLAAQVRMMITDPNRVRKNDPGNPDVCIVNIYHGIYSNATEVLELQEACAKGTVGCVDCKNKLGKSLEQVMEPIKAKRADFEAKPGLVTEILKMGAEKARKEAAMTMELVREVMKL
ncbi:MAG: tryptophan--tRNA ligase [Clostridia bacterium]|nr:tryptophan--tRNA ligase [Clostridia bacterium]